ncbi:RNA polymerase sigma-70 factor [Parapedobacter koreensis]|nr:RNA polymerase sigma-70 factor [Parapedobacter koreensis]
MNLDSEDSRLLIALQNGDTDAFDSIYHRMAGKLLQYIHSRIHNKEYSEEMVQEIFVSLWVRRQEIDIHSSIDAYLYAAAKYQLLSYIRAENVRHKYAEHFAIFASMQSENTEELINLTDLKTAIEEHVSQLPPKCQQVFRLSRYSGKTIPEIAQEMSISTRTVENYITQALRHLRQALSHYPWIVVLMFVHVIR